VAGDDLGAEILHEMGKVEEAAAVRQKMRPVWTEVYGPESTLMGVLTINNADDYLTLDRPKDALPLIEEAMRIWRATGKPDGTWYTQQQWARALRETGDFAGARARDEKAFQMMSELERQTSVVSWVLEGEGLDLLGLGRAGDAVERFERALAAEEQQPTGYVYEVAAIRFELARALWDSGRDRPRAQKLAAAAADGYRPDAQRYGSYFQKTLDEIEQWRTRHH
jgi:tetratricopeptide (TPR) repeat protein